MHSQQKHIQYFTMINLMKLSGLLIVLFVISACASLSKGECNRGEWNKIGVTDAVSGLKATTQLKKHRSACAKYKISPNNKIYSSGYSQGLKQFCRRESGLKFGVNKSKYLATCPVSLESTFLSGYIPGLELAMDNIQDDIDNLRHKSFRLNRRLDALYHSEKDSKKHKQRIKKLENRLDQTQSSISSKRSERNKLRSWYSSWVLTLN